VKVQRFYFEWAEPVPEVFEAALRHVLGAENHVPPAVRLNGKLMIAAAVDEGVFERLGLEKPEQPLTLLAFAITPHKLGAWLYVPTETAANDGYPETSKALAKQLAERLGGRQTQSSWRARKEALIEPITHVIIGRTESREIVETARLTSDQYFNNAHWLLDWDEIDARGVYEREIQFLDDAGQIFQTCVQHLAPDSEAWLTTMTRTRPPPSPQS
jgi:hypothetical protein